MCLFSRTHHGGGILGGLPESSLSANNINYFDETVLCFVKFQRKHTYAGTLVHAVRKYVYAYVNATHHLLSIKSYFSDLCLTTVCIKRKKYEPRYS